MTETLSSRQKWRMVAWTLLVLAFLAMFTIFLVEGYRSMKGPEYADKHCPADDQVRYQCLRGYERDSGIQPGDFGLVYVLMGGSVTAMGIAASRSTSPAATPRP